MFRKEQITPVRYKSDRCILVQHLCTLNIDTDAHPACKVKDQRFGFFSPRNEPLLEHEQRESFLPLVCSQSTPSCTWFSVLLGVLGVIGISPTVTLSIIICGGRPRVHPKGV